jgi:uracil-DNA glycosylase
VRRTLERCEIVRRELCRLESEVALCDRCYGGAPRLPVRFERPAEPPRVLILGERPPRQILESQERVGPSSPDAGSRFLAEMLAEAGIGAKGVVCGAACLCRPVDRSLEAAVSLAVCVRECAGHVRTLARITTPRVILPLGQQAVRALRLAFPREPVVQALRFPQSVGRTVIAGTTFIHPLYHTTVRARVTRPEPQQRQDWQAVGELWAWFQAGEHGPPPGVAEEPAGTPR